MRVSGKGLIDRETVLNFKFNGQPFQGFVGDTLASALLANDQRLVARSFKYHRPRGIMTAGSEEPNALVTIQRGKAQEPNIRATVQPLYEGLVAESQNAWPSLKFDVLGGERPVFTIFGSWVLLQNIHVASGLLGAGLRAVYSPCGWSWRLG